MQAQTTSLENRGYKSQKVLKESLRDGVYSRVEVVVRKERPSERFVAKTLVSSSSSQAAELLSELWFLENLRHPCLVQCIESWDSISSLWGKAIIMEFAEHGDTRKAIKSMKKAGQHLHREVVRLWLHQMLEGLAYVHSKQVIHRDLKTANVFLTDQWRRSLIGDFGEALVLETPTAFANDCVGTPYYMSPEVLNKQPYTAAVDMWATGAIFYELMALQRPFECKRGVHGVSDRLLTLALQIVNEDPNMEPLHRAGYPDTLIHFVMQMLSKDARQRPEPALLLKDTKLWSDFDVADSEWLAVEAFAISEEARGVDRERIIIRDQATRIPTKESRRSIAQLQEVNIAIPEPACNLVPLVVPSGCSSPSTTSGPSSPSTASGCSSPSSWTSTASGPSSPSNVSGSSGWASKFLDQVMMLKAAATFQLTSHISYRRANTV
jgi:serine/threonine protein kinase